MSLDIIQLPAIVIQELYRHSLVDLKKEENDHGGTFGQALSTLGNNRQHILVLVDNDDALFLPDDQLNFLLGILSACNLTMEDVAILNIKKNPPVNYRTITDELKPEKLFLFGVKPAQLELPLDFPDYQIQPYNNQVYVTAPLLSHFHDNKAEKTKLWNCLRQIFNI